MENQNPLCCPRCECRKVLLGHNLNSSGLPTGINFGFDPPRNRFWRFLSPFRLRLLVPGDFRLCLICGLVWSGVDPALAQDKIRLEGSRLLREQFGLNEKPIMADDELDGPF